MKQIHNSLLKLLILASLLVLFIGVIPSVYAADIVASGYCGGEAVIWYGIWMQRAY